MRSGSFDLSSLICLECGNIFTIPRRRRKHRADGHIKDLWCPICKEVRKHYEIQNIDNFLYNHKYNDEVRQYVRDIISNGISEDYERKDRVFKKILKR